MASLNAVATMAKMSVVPNMASFLRAEDAAFSALDSEENEEQAGRNAQMRDMLRSRRQARASQPQEEKAEAPEDFMSVAPTAASSSSTASLQASGVEAAPCRPPWFVDRPEMSNTVLRLHEELLDFLEFMTHSKEETAARNGWVKTIEATCRGIWPACEVKIFGSFSTGLSLPNGDVDIAVLNVKDPPSLAMKTLADRMLANGDVSWLELIAQAKVPVLKLRAQESGLRADVVFSNAGGLETSQFIKDRCAEYPQMRPMLVFLKYFLLQRGLHETFTGGMGSYLLCNVVLHFLQRHPSKSDPRVYAATSLGHLLFDFFKYYAVDFSYEYKGICVKGSGHTFNKNERGWTGANQWSSRGHVKLCLESPLPPPGTWSDLGAACWRMHVIQNLFKHALNCLSHLFVVRAGPEVSLLCPLLLDPTHPVIKGRHTLLIEQPVALLGLKRAASGDAAAAAGPDVSARPAKRRRSSRPAEGVGSPAADPFSVDGCAEGAGAGEA